MAQTPENDFACAETMGALFAAFREKCVRRGVSLLSVVAPLPFCSVSAPNTTLLFWGYNRAWQAEYLSEGWNVTDRIEDRILEHGAPILWRDIDAKIELNEANRRILANFIRYHGCDGISVPMFGHHAFQALLSFTLNGGIDSVDDARAADVIELAAQAHRHAISLRRDQHLPKVALSAREQEVLLHMASGHSKKAAARELGISTNSIDTYQRRIFSKLEVHDRTEAVVRSLSLGLVKL